MKKIVIKIGSSFFIKQNKVNRDNIIKLTNQISVLTKSGVNCCLISSGAVAVGVKKMGYQTKPTDIVKKQACAAVGQASLMQFYDEIFDKYSLKCAQILLNHDDFGNRNRSMSLKKTIDKLFEMGVVPIINENDALAVEEIKVGDNDTLSAMVSLVVGADLLVLVSDVDGLYSSNPKTDANAKIIKEIDKIDGYIREISGGAGSEFGTGGMSTKIRAGEIATSSGIPMMIINKEKIDLLYKVAQGENIGSLFKPDKTPLGLKLSWIEYCANVKGKITVDDGAVSAVKNRKSLLLCGVVSAEGQFSFGDVVSIYSLNGDCIAKGICRIGSGEIKKSNKKSKNKVLIHANDLAVIGE